MRGQSPDLAVVVASHDRPVRLRFLLNALEEQTLARERFEVIVAHDSRGPETEDLLSAHPLAAAGVLRHLSFAPGPGPAQKRNAAWRDARAPTIVFTDDDCRPPADWLERMAGAIAATAPGAIVQGATRPDPDEAGLLHVSPRVRTQSIDPPTVWAQTCNIAYPRELLERLGGFDASLPVASGEDTDLAARALASGARLVAAPEARTFHAVEILSPRRRLEATWRWQHLAAVVKRHPELRRSFTARVFWKPSHPLLLLGVAGVTAAATRRRPAAAALALPWALRAMPRYGASPRGRARAVAELPGRALTDAVEVAAMARGSVRYRTLCL
jgi:GT2 family glycosyltransferase